MQLKLHTSIARYRVAAFGRQSGKSTWGANELLKRAWEKPNTKYWFISPTYDQAKVQYRRVVGSLWDCRDILVKKNQTELRIKLCNQSEITFKSGDNFDALRGETLNGAIIDEVRDQSPELWPMVIRPMLSTTQGWAAFISTPRGFDQFYDLAEIAKSDTSGTWAFFQAPSTCNPLFTSQEFESAKRDMSEPEFAQEILAEFRDLTAGKAYVSFSAENLVEKNPLTTHGGINEHLPVVVACDFNLSPMAWMLAQQHVDRWYVFDEIFLRNTNTQEASKVLVDKILGLKSQIGRIPTVIVVGDATGKASQRAAAGQSDYDIMIKALKDAGITVINETPESNPLVKDRVNTVNSKLKDANGVRKLFVNKHKCPNLRKDFDRVTWKEGTSVVLDQSGSNKELTHASDAIGYAICKLDSLSASPSSGGLRIIRR